MTILFLRHGDAVESTHVHDAERPLSDLGQRQASSVGRFLQTTNEHVECILCSPLVRAKETAEVLERELGTVLIRPTEFLISSSEPRDIILELQELKKERVLLVGHEPHLSKTISYLLSGDTRSVVEMRKSSLACVSVDPPIAGGRGILRWLLSSGQMMKM